MGCNQEHSACRGLVVVLLGWLVAAALLPAGHAMAQPVLLGEWPEFTRDGEAQSVRVHDDLAYVASGLGGLFIMDISDPARPRLRSRLDTDGFARAVAVSNQRAYVADSENGLVVVDVSAPGLPVVLGRASTDGMAEDVQVAGDRAYVAIGLGGVAIFGISNPASPVLLGTIATLGRAGGLHVVGSLVYVAEGHAGLQIYDASNPSSPARLGGVDTPGFATAVAVGGTLACVADGPGGLQSVSVAVPSAPVLIGSLATGGDAVGVWIQDGLAAVASARAGWQLVSLSNPAAPVLVAAVATRGAVVGVHLGLQNAAVADLHSGLSVFRITTPATPVPVGGVAVSGEAQAITVVDQRAYVADWSGGLEILDVANPTRIQRLGGIGNGTSVSDVEVTGTTAYVADYRDGLLIFDVSNPEVPVRLGEFSGVSQLVDLEVTGGRAYLAHAEGLEIVDIGNPAAPVRLGRYPTDGDVFRVTVLGTIAYLGVRDSLERPGFQVVDVGNAAAPGYLGGFHTVGPVSGISLDGTRAYVAASESGLLILDVGNPATITLISAVATAGPARGVNVAGGSAFVAEDGAGLGVFDVRSPGSVRRIAGTDTRGAALAARLLGSWVHVADGRGGVAVVTQSTPVNTPPRIADVPDQEIDEGAPWQFALTITDADLPANTWTVSLLSGPAGATVSPSGVVRWTPSEAQGPATHTMVVAATDNGLPPMTGTNSFRVRVREVNRPPVLAGPGPQSVDEQKPFSLLLEATDPDLPPNLLTHWLVNGPPGLEVSASGQVTWTPTEAQGPGDFPVVVAVRDDGVPSLSATNEFLITVREVNTPPVLVPVPRQEVDEMTLFTLQLAGRDEDLPANLLVFERVSGPEGLTVSASGMVSWTPTEAQGPGDHTVVVRVTDNGSPPLSGVGEFVISVREVNLPPSLAAVPLQTVDSLAPLTLTLVGSDPDLPSNALRYSFVRGPEGLTVADDGAVFWKPAPGQAPSTNAVVVQVTDGGVPPLSATREFSVIALEVEERAVIQIGEDHPTGTPLPIPYSEFRPQNNRNDPPPGQVTRLPEDPQYDPASNPEQDDDFYVRGIYPRGFNQLSARLLVPNDEPPSAWEHSLTLGDPTNRWHFRLTERQAVPETWIRLVMEFAAGGSIVSGSVVPGFADHDISVRFRNGAGVATEVFSNRVSTPEVVVVEFPLSDVAAQPGANTIEIVRNGPAVPGVSYWITWDFLRLEVDAGGNEPPEMEPVPVQTIPEEAPWSLSLRGTDPDDPPTPIVFSLVAGPSGLTITPEGVVRWTPTEAQGPSTNVVRVRLTDNGVPRRSATNELVVVVQEVNRPPVLAAVPDQTVDEQSLLTVPLGASDPDLPPNRLTYSLVSGPPGLVVGDSGVVRWTPGEEQGPAEYRVVVKVTDNGVPPLEDTREFGIRVREVNTPPNLDPVFPQTVDALVPLTLGLAGSDPDLPANRLQFSLVSGPDGLTVGAGGDVFWKPEPGQVPSTNRVTVRVTDDGVPPLWTDGEFLVVAMEVEERDVIQIGIDNDPSEIPYAEFQPQNNRNDPPPGQVTRVAGDPQYNPLTNPGRDDDFYVRGIYPPGFNSLTSRLVVPNDEPSSAWEHSLTLGDPTNRWHFRLTERQAVPETWIRLVMELPLGGASVGGVVAPGFGDHDLAVRFRNGAGRTTEIFAERLSEPRVVTIEFPLDAVEAAAGANTIEIVRTGPSVAGTSYWVVFDFLRMEIDAGGNEAPILDAVPPQAVDEETLWTVTLQGRDPDVPPTPLTYGLVSGPPGVTVTPEGVVRWTPTEAQGPSTNVVRVRVTDNGVPIRSTTNEISVVVREVNRPPTLSPIEDRTIAELTTLVVRLDAADADLPSNHLIYSLLEAPSGMTVDEAGVLQWIPSEAQGPGTFLVRAEVRDDGVPSLAAVREFRISVLEVNTPPMLEAVPDLGVLELRRLEYRLLATDVDLPENQLVFDLITGPPGLALSSEGLMSWTPTEAQGPGVYPVEVRVTDDGVPPMSASRQFLVSVAEENLPPVFEPVPDATIPELQLYERRLTATDPDLPRNALAYSLVTGPDGMSVTPEGALAWRPTEAQGPGVYPIEVRVTDDGIPPLHATTRFTLTVDEVNEAPVIEEVPRQTIPEMVPWTLALTMLDPDLPPNVPTFTLESGPDGMTLSPSGVVSWNPTAGPRPVHQPGAGTRHRQRRSSVERHAGVVRRSARSQPATGVRRRAGSIRR